MFLKLHCCGPTVRTSSSFQKMNQTELGNCSSKLQPAAASRAAGLGEDCPTVPPGGHCHLCHCDPQPWVWPQGGHEAMDRPAEPWR
jgi:hypothetical protein